MINYQHEETTRKQYCTNCKIATNKSLNCNVLYEIICNLGEGTLSALCHRKLPPKLWFPSNKNVGEEGRPSFSFKTGETEYRYIIKCNGSLTVIDS